MMKNMILILSILTTIGFGLYTGKVLMNESAMAHEYKVAYELIRLDQEALYRTIGRHTNTAYTCKLKK
jgi:hypothetical protein